MTDLDIFDVERSAWCALQYIPYNRRYPKKNWWYSLAPKHSIPFEFQSGLDADFPGKLKYKRSKSRIH